MWPWAHLGFGYLLYRATPAGRSTPIDGAAVLALALGTQFPDLVDKPLAWYLGALPSGRSLAHSLLAFALVVGVALVLARRDGRPEVAAGFGVGYLSHLAGDALGDVVAGDFGYLTFLGWPLTPPPDYGVEPGLLARLREFEATPTLAVGLGLALLAAGFWVRDGRPGVGTALGTVRRTKARVATRLAPRRR